METFHRVRSVGSNGLLHGKFQGPKKDIYDVDVFDGVLKVVESTVVDTCTLQITSTFWKFFSGTFQLSGYVYVYKLWSESSSPQFKRIKEDSIQKNYLNLQLIRFVSPRNVRNLVSIMV